MKFLTSGGRGLVAPIAGATLVSALALLGGASRNDLWVQPVVQIFAIAIGAVMLMYPVAASAPRITPIAWILAVLAAFMTLQLVPLPSFLWRMLPGRELEAAISDAVGLSSVWRPVSVVPDDTVSALLGIIVPVATMIVFTRTPFRLVRRLMWLVAAIGIVNLLLALGQMATGEGALFFYPRTTGTVVGLFHNRNHTAIFLGTLPPVLTFLALEKRDALDRREMLWASLTLAIVLDAFAVVITGSRIGVAVFALATAGAGLMVLMTEPRIRSRVSRPTTSATRIAVIAGCGLLCVSLVGLMLRPGDTSLIRLGATNIREEGRVSLLRPLFDLIGKYLPFGSGFGTFDRIYRMVEPEEKLRLSYLNHAHNDLLEVLIEGGIVSAVLLVVLLALSVSAARKVWRTRGPFSAERDAARVGSLVAAGLMLGSISDYPLRTPMLAAWMTLALCLLLARHGHGGIKAYRRSLA